MATEAAQVTRKVSLRHDAIGLREVTFQSITDMAPGAAIAASIPAGVARKHPQRVVEVGMVHLDIPLEESEA
jgi:hypothetical protein